MYARACHSGEVFVARRRDRLLSCGVPDDGAVDQILIETDDLVGMPPDAVAGGASELAERLSMWDELCVERVVPTIAAGEWFWKAEPVAEAVRSPAAR